MLDLRGCGESDGERLNVDKLTDYVTDVETVMNLLKALRNEYQCVMQSRALASRL
jgi:alpha-beta hydrolase superfamily lysophospholipase